MTTEEEGLLEEELLERRLKWLREAQRINEDRHTAFANDYLECFHNHIIPSEFSALCDVEDEVLNDHIRRIEQDLQDARANEFRIE
ncbi:hypothetical protein Z052_02930 [Halorubrum sp. C191]|uniref:hypothetical protein n=1 Tax=Halorubrum sp. C191 TaxID=1383842 RepID=UPI000C073A3E|nr:hypothetical protein [Halorubrum sp. C191]PHQ43605.1 hypothetical protein Z052_02930 [Halorubrum sp. C191]